MAKLDCIIVGGGLAGTVLAWELEREKKTFIVLGDAGRPSSSRVAGGLFNPVTGKYLAKTWLAEELFSYLEVFYPRVEEATKSRFFHPIGLYRPFSGVSHRESAQVQIDKHQLLSWITVEDRNLAEHFYSADAGMYSQRAGWLDLPRFLDESKKYFGEKYIEHVFQYEALTIEVRSVKYEEWEADHILFCEGVSAQQNPWFSWLPFNPVKGETLIGKVKNYSVDCIVNQGKWLIPMGDERLRLGATYSWHELDFTASAKGREELLGAAKRMLREEFVVEGQEAGVRPATKDRRPFVGVHPHYGRLGIFNGLGAKGVSLAPYFAKQFVGNLLRGEVINPEANIERFYALYS